MKSIGRSKPRCHRRQRVFETQRVERDLRQRDQRVRVAGVELDHAQDVLADLVDTVVGALWAVGMSVGILLIKITPGYHTELMSYLFGNILMVTSRDLWLIAALDVIVLATVALFHKQLLAVCFDGEFAGLRYRSVVRPERSRRSAPGQRQKGDRARGVHRAGRGRRRRDPRRGRQPADSGDR